jgi:hypothetical protein
MPMSFFKGFASLFSWMDCFHDLSPKERVDEILDNFYLDHPYLERDDLKAIQKDNEAVARDFYTMGSQNEEQN